MQIPTSASSLATLDDAAWNAVVTGDPAQGRAWMGAAARLGSARAQVIMGQWLLELPLFWMAAVVFAATYLVAGITYWVVTRLAAGNETGSLAFRSVSPGMLPPLGIIFGLLVGFTAGGPSDIVGRIVAQQLTERCEWYEPVDSADRMDRTHTLAAKRS